MQQQPLFSKDPAPWELDDADERLVASVVMSEEPFGPYDYVVPEHLRSRVEAGRRVRIPLGRGNRTRTGYCVQVSSTTAHAGRLKEIHGVLDESPLLRPAMLDLTRWIADYYLSPWGKVLDAVVPAGVRGQAGTRRTTYLDVSADAAARLSELKLPAKQAEVLRVLADSAQPMSPAQLAKAVGCTQSPIQQLRKKGLIRSHHRRELESRSETPAQREPHLRLNPDQQQALDAILAILNSARHATVLLHGITGSGKTEVYIRAIDEVLRFGRQAIVLVPEISLTPQTRQRFRSRFDNVAVLHSQLSDSERHWHWQRISRGQVQVIVGARSAIFAPTPHLGLIVLDEEHDASFKQDKLPRYHARTVALRRATVENVPLVLGSATPSLESWHHTTTGAFQRVDLPRRVENRPLPDVAAIDLRSEYGSRSGGAISRGLHRAIHDALRDDGQVILLLNRRGYSTTIQCPACGHVVNCVDCDLALTHHREAERAICHYCDYQIDTPQACPECRFGGIRYGGLGTQKLEREVQRRFANVSCLRVDSDTMRRPGSHEAAFARFRSGEIKILVGTQMIAKGLDFPNVTLVGVVNADTALHFPDFRAAERTFQLVTQVAGRTGRGDKGGRVLVQTYSPEHPAIQAALRHDYPRFVAQEMTTRRQFGYPPLTTMVRIIIRSPHEGHAEQFAELLGQRAARALDEQQGDTRLMGPSPAPITKLRGKFRFHLLLIGQHADDVRAASRRVTSDLDVPDDVEWLVDVDPVDLL